MYWANMLKEILQLDYFCTLHLIGPIILYNFFLISSCHFLLVFLFSWWHLNESFPFLFLSYWILLMSIFCLTFMLHGWPILTFAIGIQVFEFGIYFFFVVLFNISLTHKKGIVKPVQAELVLVNWKTLVNDRHQFFKSFPI